MPSSLVLTILLVFSFGVGDFLRRFQTTHFVFSGMIFLLCGMLAGSHLGIGILSKELLLKLAPLTSLLIGIVGYLLGLRVKLLIKEPGILLTGFASATLVFIIVASTFIGLAPYLLPHDLFQIDFIPMNILGTTYTPRITVNQLWFCIGAGATACSASLMNLGSAMRTDKSESEISRVLALLTKAVQCVAIIIIGVSLAAASGSSLADKLGITLWQWILASIFSGILCALLFSLFIGRQSNSDRIMLAALGTIIFASGIGIVLGVSSLFVAFTTGATLSMVSSYEAVLRENLTKLEEPIFVLLLIICGASWEPTFDSVWLLPLVYFVARLMIFSIFPQRIYRAIHGEELTRLGQGLLGQDLMAVALAISFAQQFPSVAQMFLTTILGSIFLNDLIAIRLLRKVILDNELKTSVQTIDVQKGPS